jgi:hypothetical protein
VTDPDRLFSMNRSLFLWFEAGMPMDPAWNPPPVAAANPPANPAANPPAHAP